VNPWFRHYGKKSGLDPDRLIEQAQEKGGLEALKEVPENH
jgi:hypothetical protein